MVDPSSDLPPSPTATLSFDEGAPAISGSVAALFETPVFSGPNRIGKSDRARPQESLVAFAQRFDAVRLSIASARSSDDIELEHQSSVQVANLETGRENRNQIEEGPRISVAAIDTDVTDSEGLRAIDAVADEATGGADLVSRVEVPQALAYGRENTPATDFTPKHDWSEREQWCLSTGIYFEARGETHRGQVAVAQTIMNRVDDDRYPDTICGVVYQNQHRRNACQFSFACDGIADRVNEPPAWAKAQEITQSVLNKEIFLTEVADATHYHATYVRPHWARNMDRLTQVGLHVFYRFKPGWIFG